MYASRIRSRICSTEYCFFFGGSGSTVTSGWLSCAALRQLLQTPHGRSFPLHTAYIARKPASLAALSSSALSMIRACGRRPPRSSSESSCFVLLSKSNPLKFNIVYLFCSRTMLVTMSPLFVMSMVP